MAALESEEWMRTINEARHQKRYGCEIEMIGNVLNLQLWIAAIVMILAEAVAVGAIGTKIETEKETEITNVTATVNHRIKDLEKIGNEQNRRKGLAMVEVIAQSYLFAIVNGPKKKTLSSNARMPSHPSLIPWNRIDPTAVIVGLVSKMKGAKKRVFFLPS